MMMCPTTSIHSYLVRCIFNEIMDQLDDWNNAGSESTRIDLKFFETIDTQKIKKKYLEPDIFVGKNILWSGNNVASAPELVIEVLSIGTAKEDRTVKKDLYKAIGVKEYILVSQDWKVELYKLNTDNSNCYEDIIDVFESTYLDIKINFESIYSKVYKKLNLGVE